MKIQIILLLTFFPYQVFSQYQLLNNSLIDPSTPVLYVGIENIIEIIGPADLLDYELSVSSGLLTKKAKSKNLYWLKVNNNKCNFDTLTVKYKNKELFSKVYKIEIIGELVAKAGNIADTVVTTSELISNPFLTVDIPQCDWKHNYYIKSYSVYFVINKDSVPFNLLFPKGSIDSIYIFTNETFKDSLITIIRTEDFLESTITNDKFPLALIDKISNLQTGDQIIFHWIKADCPSCTSRSLDPIRYHISN